MKAFVLFYLVLAITLLSNASALEIDEKLTLRILKTSNTKKTVLINRGLEDGLVVGDHAKFFLTTGVIARGVVVKASPTRSIWSFYRIIDADSVINDKVMNLKISTPLKLTEDPSKALHYEPIAPGGRESISVTRGDQIPTGVEVLDSREELTVDEQDELTQMEASSAINNNMVTVTGVHASRTWEAFGMLHLSSLSGEYTEGENEGVSAKDSSLALSLGVEKYFAAPKSFLGDLSFGLFIHKRSTGTGNAVIVSQDWTEFGVSGSYHFYNRPLSFSRPILFANLAAGIGSVDITQEVNSTSTGTSVPETQSGSSNFFSLGLGAKYYLPNGFGGRALLDYYRSGATFDFEDTSGNSSETTLAVSGLRVQLGLSYRF